MTRLKRLQIEVSEAPADTGTGELLAVPLTAAAASTWRETHDPHLVGEDEGTVSIATGRPRTALLGLGAEIDDDAVRTAAAAATRAARGVEQTLVWSFDGDLTPGERQVRAVVEGVVLGGYDPARWKTTPAKEGIDRVVIAGAPFQLATAAARAEVVARWTNEARVMVDAPPNELTPEGLAERAAELMSGTGVEVEVLDRTDIESAGLHAVAAVGRGSVNEPRFIVLRYGAAVQPSERVAFVGKGVTFDSGGYFLKPQSDIVKQKADMGGAAAVIGAVGALAELDVPISVLAVVPAVENMLGGAAYRPSDIVATASGLTVEVTNPDAEGRLLLADAIWYARQSGVGRIVDVATLTGAMRGGMGDLYAGVFANSVALRDEIVAAGEASGDYVWPWPLHRRYAGPLESSLADLRNTAGRGFGYPIFAAKFLERFVGEVPWAHVDIHSTAFLDEPRGYLGAGATGAGVRALTEFAVRATRAT